ncbi:hypothetical protein DFP72DRAFT_1072594 [Ephemerocybe angulata]|uniref:Uncharacterized protein n=1 Tax=Ephemerocybe angulata TaxID=980116 RepID=A0A8H6M1X9_9AGAR|nr:hypothetical protein DFP72DRAFT_1072594 [Tulosesus angulatus]
MPATPSTNTLYSVFDTEQLALSLAIHDLPAFRDEEDAVMGADSEIDIPMRSPSPPSIPPPSFAQSSLVTTSHATTSTRPLSPKKRVKLASVDGGDPRRPTALHLSPGAQRRTSPYKNAAHHRRSSSTSSRSVISDALPSTSLSPARSIRSVSDTSIHSFAMGVGSLIASSSPESTRRLLLSPTKSPRKIPSSPRKTSHAKGKKPRTSASPKARSLGLGLGPLRGLTLGKNMFGSVLKRMKAGEGKGLKGLKRLGGKGKHYLEMEVETQGAEEEAMIVSPGAVDGTNLTSVFEKAQRDRIFPTPQTFGDLEAPMPLSPNPFSANNPYLSLPSLSNPDLRFDASSSSASFSGGRHSQGRSLDTLLLPDVDCEMPGSPVSISSSARKARSRGKAARVLGAECYNVYPPS